MSEHIPRLDSDRKSTQDWPVNPKAVERKARQAAENSVLEAEAAAPWGRDKIVQMLDKLRSQEPIHVNGQDQPRQLNLHGVELPENIDLTGLNLSHANMHGVKTKGARFSGCDLSYVNAHGAVFTDCVFDDALSMESINLCQSCLSGSSFTGVEAKGAASILGGETLSGGLTSANLSESCCHGTVKGLDIQEHELTTQLVDDVGRSLDRRLAPGETHACGECPGEFVSVKGRIEHSIRSGHGKWTVRNDIKMGAQETTEPAVMDTRLWLQMKGRRPIIRGGKLRSTGPQLWRANVTGMLVGHKDRTPDPAKPKISVSGVPDECVV